MIQLVATAATFAFGLLFLPILFPGMRVRGIGSVLWAGVIGGALSALLGKVIFVLLSLVFLPIGWLGPVGAFVVQVLVNLVLLRAIARSVDGVEFDGLRTSLWASVALTVLQTLVRLAAPGS
jgi:uncharacterized membrane protein YvlD (DUF360 family)